MATRRRKAPARYRRVRLVTLVQSGDDRFTATSDWAMGPQHRPALLTENLAKLWLAVRADTFCTAEEVHRELPAALRRRLGAEDLERGLAELAEAGLLERPGAASGYDLVADRYDARPPYSERVYALLRAHTSAEHRRRVLEVGVGTGYVLEHLAEMATEWAGGVELSERLLARARERLRPWPDLELHQGSAEHLPVADESVSLLVIAQALHWFNTPRFWAEACRVLAPRHRIVVFWRWFDLSVDSVITRWCREYFGSSSLTNVYGAGIPATLPRTIGVVHYERVADSMRLESPRRALRMLQSLDMPGRVTTPSAREAEARFRALTSRADRWPLEVPCVLTFGSLVRMTPADLQREPEPPFAGSTSGPVVP